MLSVNNRTTWENFFKQLVIKNCDIEIDIGGWHSHYLTKNNIISFELSRRNSFVPVDIPNDDCRVVIGGWSSLDAYYIRDRLTQFGYLCQFRFIVENQYTGKIDLCVQKCEIDQKNDQATIYFVNPVKTRIGGYTNQGIVGGNGIAHEWSFPTKMTDGEYSQLHALFNGNGFTYNYGSYTLKTLDFTSLGNYDEINITDTNFYQEEDDRSNLKIYGCDVATAGESITLTVTQTAKVYSNNRVDLEIYVDVPYCSSAFQSAKNTSTGVNCNYVSEYDQNGRILLTVSNAGTVGNTYTYTVSTIIRKSVLLGVDKEKNDYYIQSLVFLGTAINNSKVAYAESVYRTYYANHRFVEIKGRVDPTIEPLDVVNFTIDETNYLVAIEEVNISFNGGFTGGYKGRIVEQTSFSSVEITDITFNYNTSKFSFKIKNNNKSEQLCKIETSGVIAYYYVPANSSLTINQDSTFGSDILGAFEDYWEGHLADDLIAYFPQGNSVIIREANM